MKEIRRYKNKILALITLVIFLIIFVIGFIFSYLEYKHIQYININKINKIEDKLKHFKNKKSIILKEIEEINVNKVLETIIDDQETSVINDKIKSFFGTDKVILLKDYGYIYNGFNKNLCKDKYYCITKQIDDIKITVGIKLIKKDFKQDFFTYLFLNILVTTILHFVFKIVLNKISKPVEESYEFMKNFVNNAGHEIKTPLANIDLLAQILLKKKEKNINDLEQIRNQVKEIKSIIDTLLEISLLTHNINKNKEKINLKQEIKKILGNYKNELKDFKVNLELSDKYIYTNKYYFDILFRNLLTNAIKYNNDKKEIDIILTYNNLIVSNTGNTLTKEEIKKIFDLFYRIEKLKPGYGLGLSIVKKIVDYNNWKINIISKNNKNIFKIIL